MNISRALKFLAIPTLVCIYVGCSPVNFAKDEELNKCQNSGKNCLTLNGKDFFDETVTVAGGLVDILIVNDNSASMSFEQTQLATRLRGFIQNLEAQHADYRIAITTTDISNANNPARPINQNGALQDGRLIAFKNGSYYLTPSSGTLAEKEELFKYALERPETNTCETFIKNNYGKSTYSAAYSTYCPSGDERGIFATNLVIKNNPNSFLRANAHLAVIVLADEDERSELYKSPAAFPGYALESMDQPQSLLNNLRNVYGGGKQLSVHSIVTASDSCKVTQSNQMIINGQATVLGSIGNIYMQASQMTQGVIGDICASDKDYTAQLGQISTNILNRINSINLACANPVDLSVSIIGQPGVTYSLAGNLVKFSSQLVAGTTVKLKYTCDSL